MLIEEKCYLVSLEIFKQFIKLKRRILGDFLSSAEQKCFLKKVPLKIFENKSVIEMPRKIFQGKVSLYFNRVNAKHIHL